MLITFAEDGRPERVWSSGIAGEGAEEVEPPEGVGDEGVFDYRRVDGAWVSDPVVAGLQAEAERAAAKAEATSAALAAAVRLYAQSLPDEQAATVAALFEDWAAGVGYAAGDRVCHGAGLDLYRCLQAHTSQEGWEPGAAPSLWARILPGQGGEPAGEWVQPDSTNPYMKGDKVTHGGRTWASDIDNNVWEPGVYGWTEEG